MAWLMARDLSLMSLPKSIWESPSMTSMRGFWIISSTVKARVQTSWYERSAAWALDVAVTRKI